MQHPTPRLRFSIKAYFVCISVCCCISFLPIFGRSDETQVRKYSYEPYCHDFFQRHDDEGGEFSKKNDLNFQRATVTGGSPLFDVPVTRFSLKSQGPTALFTAEKVNEDDGRILVEGKLILNKRTRLVFDRTRRFKRDHAPYSQSGYAILSTKGLLDPRSGILCMAACFEKKQLLDSWLPDNRTDCQVKAVIRYPVHTSLRQPLLEGKLLSQRKPSDPLFFEPIILTGRPSTGYAYTGKQELQSICALRHSDVPAIIEVWKDDSAACQFPYHKQPLSVVWDPQCTDQDCFPFDGFGPTAETSLSIENMMCSSGMVRGYLVFTSVLKQKAVDVQQAKIAIVAVEGSWNADTGQLCMAGCYLRGATNGSLLYEPLCDLTVTLQFPITLNLLFRYSVIGHIEMSKSLTYLSFRRFKFTGHMDISYGSIGWGKASPNIKYIYTEAKLTQVHTKCPSESNVKLQNQKGHGSSNYPDAHVFSDLGFQAVLEESLWSKGEAYFSPISVNDKVNRFSVLRLPPSAAGGKPPSVNVSFSLNFKHSSQLRLLRNTSVSTLSAEGVYRSKSGLLCLVACRSLNFSNQPMKHLDDGDKDCQILITLKYPPMNPGLFGERRVQGQIASLREQTDTLFFDPMSLSSSLIVYQGQAAEALLQVDVEIVLSIVSLSISTAFIGLQLRHTQKYAAMAPNVSILMLFLLTLGHFVPLVLHFEAVFAKLSRQDVLSLNGGWLEINEVVLMLMTMLAFLLLTRLLYLTWTSKATPLKMEQQVFIVCLTIYFMGGLVVFFLHMSLGRKIFDMVKEYTGLTVDFFLFPQIVANYIWGVQGFVLSVPFYGGMTVVKLMPHVYDLVRNVHFVSPQRHGFYYANFSWDFYSKVWDGIIPSLCMVLVLVIFVQQRYGGRCLLPPACREQVSYQKLSNPS